MSWRQVGAIARSSVDLGLVDLCRDPFVRGIGYGGGVDGGGRGDAFSYANGCEPELDGFIFRSG